MEALIGYAKIETELEPAHSYTLYSGTDGNRFTAWFVDNTTGKRIDQKENTNWKRLLFGKLAD